MIIEWSLLKAAGLSAFITTYLYRKWISYNTCKTYEIKEFLKRREE